MALEQVLQGADLGLVDPLTRQYVTWVWSYSRAPLGHWRGHRPLPGHRSGTYDEMIRRPASIAMPRGREKSKKMARLRTDTANGPPMDDEDLGNGSAGPSRTPLIDQLQRAAWLWGQNRTGDLGEATGAAWGRPGGRRYGHWARR